MREKWQKLKAHPWTRRLTNKYVLASVGFALWMTFLDINSLLIHWELNREKQLLQRSIEHYQSEIAKDKLQLEELTSNPEQLEKFAREQYWMKKEGEEIYLIELP